MTCAMARCSTRRAMCYGAGMTLDATVALQRLEAAGVGSSPHAARAPRTGMEAVLEWARGWRPGGHHGPPVGVLGRLFERDAAASGSDVDWVDVRLMGRALRLLGLRVVPHEGRACPKVDRATADRLWAAAAEVAPHVGRWSHAPKQRPGKDRRRPRANAPPFHPVPSQARPVCDVWGSVYTSAAVAGRMLRVSAQRLQEGARLGGNVAGRAWRQLTPEEAARVPPGTKCGERLAWLSWRGTVAAHEGGTTHCPGCRCGGQAPTPAAQDSPHPT